MGIFKSKERLSEAAACFRKVLGSDFERLLGDEKGSPSLHTEEGEDNTHSSDTEEDNSEYDEDAKGDEFVADSILNS